MSTRSELLLPLLGLILLGTVAATGGSDVNEVGKAAYAHGDYAGAELLFSCALAQAPDGARLHYRRGVALMSLSPWREASAAFKAALRLNLSRDVAATVREGPPLARPADAHPWTASLATRFSRVSR